MWTDCKKYPWKHASCSCENSFTLKYRSPTGYSESQTSHPRYQLKEDLEYFHFTDGNSDTPQAHWQARLLQDSEANWMPVSNSFPFRTFLLPSMRRTWSLHSGRDQAFHCEPGELALSHALRHKDWTSSQGTSESQGAAFYETMSLAACHSAWTPTIRYPVPWIIAQRTAVQM